MHGFPACFARLAVAWLFASWSIVSPFLHLRYISIDYFSAPLSRACCRFPRVGSFVVDVCSYILHFVDISLFFGLFCVPDTDCTGRVAVRRPFVGVQQPIAMAMRRSHTARRKHLLLVKSS